MALPNDAYKKIAEMWTFPESESFREMLKCMFTLEEAEFLLQCTTPTTAPALAKKLNADEAQTADKLDNLAKRGLIYRGKTEYLFRRGVHYSFGGQPVSPEYAPKPEYAKWRKQWSDENPLREVKVWKSYYDKTKIPVHRVWPARLAILSNPNIKKEDLLWHEDIEQIFRRADIIISGPCGCRSGGGMGGKQVVKAEDNRGTKCDHPMWNCFQFSKEVLSFARRNGGTGNMKVYTVDEALAKSDEAERAGLIHEGPFNAAVMPGVICSCANDCCGIIISSLNSGEPMHALYAASRFLATVDQDKCTGCQTCVDRCFVESIDMEKVPGSKKMKAKIKAEDCYGCGVCVVGCPEKAIKFDLVRPADHHPPAERAYRQSPAPLK